MTGDAPLDPQRRHDAPRTIGFRYKKDVVAHDFARMAPGIGSAVMTPFKVGDRVERIGPLAPDWMKYGVITKVLPDKHGIDWATQYAVEFGPELNRTFYQNELRLVETAP